MSFARGKYLTLARATRAAVMGKGVILIVIDGANGSDVSIDITDALTSDGAAPMFMLRVASLLADIATELVKDATGLQAKLFHAAVDRSVRGRTAAIDLPAFVADMVSTHTPACIKHAITQMWTNDTLEWPCTCNKESR